jgi:hypothetical protein
MRLIVLLLIGALCTYGSCRKRGLCGRQYYAFECEKWFSPDSKSIHVNDTLWLEYSCATVQKDRITGDTISFRQASNFGTDVFFLAIEKDTTGRYSVVAAADSFELTPYTGKFVFDAFNESKNKDYRFEEFTNAYKLKLAIVPKHKGVYVLAATSLVNVFRDFDKCARASYQSHYINTDQHFELYHRFFPNYVIDGSEAEDLYCFEVE